VALINYQDLDVPGPLARRVELGTAHYYFENPSNHKLYCKYGILNALIYVPPLLIEKWHDGHLNFFSDGRAIYLNWLNIILTIASAWYLYLIASKYTASQALAATYVLTALYCTFWWYYLRAQSYEIYQVLFLLGFYYHFISSFPLSATVLEYGSLGRQRRNPCLAGAWVGALILVKTVYVLLIPISCALIVLAWLSRRDSSSSLLRRAAWFALPIGCAFCLLFAANWYQFGSPFESGWSQDGPIFSGSIPVGLHGYFFDHDHCIFVYFPIFVFALFGYPRFFKYYRLDALLFSSVTVLMLLVCSKFMDWSGGWGYGSRYLLPYLPLASLPFLNTMEVLLKNRGRWWARGCAAVIAGVLVWSFHIQSDVNALPFFGYYKLKNFFLGFHMPAVEEYFKSHSFFEVDADLLAYKHGKPWPVLVQTEPVLNARGVVAVKGLIQLNSMSNYYFWPDASPRQ
jgi:hypothetical protein